MKKESIKYEIVRYIESEGGFVFGGKIEDYIRSIHGAKASNASRRCRELENAGILTSIRVQVNNEGPWVVKYGIKPKTVFVSHQTGQLAFL